MCLLFGRALAVVAAQPGSSEHFASPCRVPIPCRSAAAPPCRIEPVSWKPRAFVYHNFMTEEEADHIVSLAKPFVSHP